MAYEQEVENNFRAAFDQIAKLTARLEKREQEIVQLQTNLSGIQAGVAAERLHANDTFLIELEIVELDVAPPLNPSLTYIRGRRTFETAEEVVNGDGIPYMPVEYAIECAAHIDPSIGISGLCYWTGRRTADLTSTKPGLDIYRMILQESPSPLRIRFAWIVAQLSDVFQYSITFDGPDGTATAFAAASESIRDPSDPGGSENLVYLRLPPRRRIVVAQPQDDVADGGIGPNWWIILNAFFAMI